MRMGIVGADAMGQAIARRAALSGAVVLLGDRSAGKARKAAAVAAAGTSGVVVPTTVAAALRPDTVVLALSWCDALDLVTRRSGSLAGKVIVDVTVPARPDPASSAVQRLAAAAPAARWVKAFGTADASALYAGKVDGHVVDVFVASDDEGAKVQLVELVDRSGLRAFDAGGMDSARVLEDMARLGQEISDRLLLTGSWGYKFLPGW
jgi:predicted dinucleotide-binding enzyme